MPHKKLFLSLLALLFLQITVAQKVIAIDQKGTKVTVINNKVTDSVKPHANPNSNDVWFDTSTTPTAVKIYDGTTWLIMEHKGTEGSLFFAAKNGLPTEDNSQLFWNAANNRLGVGTNSPSDKLTVNGSVSSMGIFNTGAISNSGLFTNGAGINNTGTITNTGAITNSGLLTNNAGIVNTGGITNIGRIKNDNGAVGTPSYSFTDDTNTGIYRPAEDQLAFSTKGTQALFIDAAQQVNFLKNVRLAGKLLDGSSLSGTAGQVLTSTSSGTKWQTNTNWLISGNSGTTASNFLGTTDNVKMTIRSDNLPMLEFGRRKTLNLTANYPDYRDDSQPVVYVRGDTIRSALQFAADGASFYKPMFYTVKNGSFRLKGSAGGTDMFEIGSAGSNNNGRLEFIVGDDGKEPMIFSRYEFRPTSQGLKEFFRVQGSKDAENAKTRFGINLNPTSVPLDPTYNTDDNGAIANSTFQVNGSISNSIIDTGTSTTLTLNEDHYAIILKDNFRQIITPAADSSKGRIYVIKNPTLRDVAISSYKNNINANSKVIASGTTLWIQSDGTYWQQISPDGGSSGSTVKSGSFIIEGPFTANLVNSSNAVVGKYRTIPLPNFKFNPSQITFTTNSTVDSENMAAVTDSNANSFGNSTGYYSNDNGTISQQFSFSGGSNRVYGNAYYIAPSSYASSSYCIGVVYYDLYGREYGRISARVSATTSTTVTLEVFYVEGNSGGQIYNKKLLVLYTANK
ncbi:hypothetical protein [Flavobacterium sp. 14A]|uniref:hypothetical protein n=1 Tax=Flavobacterium sp. 14A TaxID=2735896 RepID=UPI00156DA96B|nr:hypothetical protein [Flavobacterium sp. 14A]NRT12882.1 hypothetical protein [Flavobacterium sp. 14A]